MIHELEWCQLGESGHMEKEKGHFIKRRIDSGGINIDESCLCVGHSWVLFALGLLLMQVF